MDAAQVISNMNSTWLRLMDKYYDHIAEEYIKWMATEYNMPIDELTERAKPVKAQILATVSSQAIQPDPPAQPSEIKKVPKKPVKKPSSAESTSQYASMSRKDLAELCKQRKLTVRRKNLDMIQSLDEQDAQNAPPVPDVPIEAPPAVPDVPIEAPAAVPDVPIEAPAAVPAQGNILTKEDLSDDED